PELAPSLGRVLVPRRLEEPWVPLDDIREELATRVIELGGEARAAAAGEDRDRVLDAVSRRAWLGAWEAAVRRAGERVTAALGGEIERAARRVRMPRRLRRRRLLTGPEKRAIAARLAAGGQPGDRKSTRLNSSHVSISYAVFCLKKKNMLDESGDEVHRPAVGCTSQRADRL